MTNSLLKNNLVESAADELLFRRQARSSLSEFTKYVTRGDALPLVPARWHRLLCSVLERIALPIEDPQRLSRVIVCAPPNHAKDVSEDTLVLKSSGERIRLGDVVIGDEIITHEGRGRKVLGVHYQGMRECLSIKTQAGREVVAHLEHPFLTPYGWVQAQQLKIADLLAVIPKPQLDYEPITDQIRMACRLAGYFVGDGSVTTGVRFTNADLQILDDFERLCAGLGFETTRVQYQKERKCFEVNVRKALPWLREIGLAGHNSYTKRVPPFVFKAGPEGAAEFLAGYFACDGSVCFRRTGVAHIQLSSVHHELLMDCQSLLLRTGINSKVKSRKGVYKRADYPYFELSLRGVDDGSKFRQHIPIVGDKRERLLQCPFYRTNFDRRFIPDRIVSITPVGLVRTLCLTVDEDHSFTANDIVVHNSTYCTKLFPAWILGKRPECQIICASHSEGLATKFSYDVRGFLQTNEYKNLFGDILDPNRSGVTEWRTRRKGSYRAVGVGTRIFGERANIAIIDDPIGSDKDANSTTIRDAVGSWFGSDLLSRLDPMGAIMIIATRYHFDDLIGRILESQKTGGEQWTLICLPAIAGENDPLERKPGEALWPERIPLEWLERKRKDPMVGARAWSSLYQQSPLPEGGSILPRDNWKHWLGNKIHDDHYDGKFPNNLEKIVFSLDTAFKEKQENDFSALTIWGIFRPPPPRKLEWAEKMAMIRESKNRVRKRGEKDFSPIDTMTEFKLDYFTLQKILSGENVPEPREATKFDVAAGKLAKGTDDVPHEWTNPEPFNAILLDAWHERLSYPDLRRRVLREINRWKPDDIIIEDKASGQSLIQEFARAGIQVHPHNPGREKLTFRANMVAGVFESGYVYAMSRTDTTGDAVFRTQIEQVIEECERFPSAAHDDFVATVVQFIHYMRNLGALRTVEDLDIEDDRPRKRRRATSYA